MVKEDTRVARALPLRLNLGAMTCRLTLCLVICGAVFSQGFVISTTQRFQYPRKFSITIPADATRSSRVSRMAKDGEDPDLFYYFDPLLSPHAYPNGISPDNPPEEDEQEQERYDPLRIPSAAARTPQPGGTFGGRDERIPGPEKLLQERETYKPLGFSSTESPRDQQPNVFDPRLSPHAYPNGTPATLYGDKLVVDQQDDYRIGILLMDHGSRLQASNDRLHEIAKVYQTTVGKKFVVRAAHMEIASPSIPEGLEKLLEDGVDEIVCHPYFLSANGRHVSQDIPQILSEAIESLSIKVPIVTTEPVGANTQVMIGAIQSIVQQSTSGRPHLK